MHIRYDIEKLKQIITDLCVLTGISMSFLDTDRRMLFRYQKEGDFCSVLQRDPRKEKLCLRSDEILLGRALASKRFESHVCHAGLFDAAMPIMKNGVFAGIVLMGRVRLAEGGQPSEGLYSALPAFREEQIKSLETLLPNVLFESAVFVEFDDRSSEISEYIKNNLSEPLSVDTICKRFLMSKNTLYALFKEHFERTVTEYITDLRMEKSRSLLRETNDPVYEIAERVGINNYTYFCKLFKKKEGMSPTEYRKGLPSE